MHALEGDLTDFGDCLTTFSDTDFSSVEKVIDSKSRTFLGQFYASKSFDSLPRKVKYLIKAKINFTRKTGPVKREKDNILCNVQFSHSIIGNMNLNSILCSAEVAGKLPSDIKKKFDIRQGWQQNFFEKKPILAGFFGLNRIKSCVFSKAV